MSTNGHSAHTTWPGGAQAWTPDRAPGALLPISAIVPALNAEDWVESCLRAVRANGPAEIILVNGPSQDATVERGRPLADRVIDLGPANVAQARTLGVAASTQPWLAFIDVDVVLPDGALAALFQEASERNLDGLQAGLRSVGAGDYWSEALAEHHNAGRSRHWFGLNATLVTRELMLRNPLDQSFDSGEDIEFRFRMRRQHERIGVSRSVEVRHRFRAGYAFATEQWLADGAGLGRLVRKHGSAALPSAMIPFGAAALGIVRGIGSGFRLVPYYVGFGLGNLVGLMRGLADVGVPLGSDPLDDVRDEQPAASGAEIRTLGSTPRATPSTRRDAAVDEISAVGAAGPGRSSSGQISVGFSLALLVASLAGALAIVAVMPGVGATVGQAPLPALVSLAAIGLMIAVELGLAADRPDIRRIAGRVASVAVLVALVALVASGVRFAGLVGLVR